MNFLIHIMVVCMLVEAVTIVLKSERYIIQYSICQYIMATSIIIMQAINISYSGQLLTSIFIILAQLIYIVIITKEIKWYIKRKKGLEENSQIE